MYSFGHIVGGFQIECSIFVSEDFVLDSLFEKKRVLEDIKRYGRKFLTCIFEFPVFCEELDGCTELNSLILEITETCRSAVKGTLLEYLSVEFGSISLYEQKFKFKPYKYSLCFEVSNLQADFIFIEIRANLSQNGRCIIKNSMPIFWSRKFNCLCQKDEK